MEAPYPIASLPQPLDKENGQTHAAPVSAFKESKKRKRHEVAVAVDGEGISIYNVQNQALVTSHAVPPQTFFCCRPCSVLCRATAGKPAQRRTYIVVKDGILKARRKVICFAKNFQKPRGDAAEYSVPTKFECDIPDGDVSGLDLIPTQSGELSFLLVAYKDGRLFSITSELSKSQELRPAFPNNAGSNEVEYSAAFDKQSMWKGILKDRPDIIAALDQAGNGGVAGDLFCQIVRTRTNRRFELCLLRNSVQDELQTLKPSLQSVMSYDLPASGKSSGTTAQHQIHAATAKVYSLIEGRLNVYELGSTIPKLLTMLGDKAVPITSFARLSTSTVAAASASTATVYETTYGSVQACGNLQVPSSAGSETKKRKRDDDGQDSQQPSFQAVSAFSELGVLVLLSGSQLLAVQVGDELSSQTRAKGRSVRLTDVLGCGTAKAALSVGQDSEQQGKATAWAAQVDNLIESIDIEGLETLVASDDTLGRQRKPEKSRRKHPAGEDVNVDEVAYGDLWPLPEPLDSTKLNRERILYILSKVFSYAPDEPQLEIRIASRKLLEWLALTGHLNCISLEKALRSSDAGVQREPIHPGDVMTAISEIDQDFQLTRSLLSLPARWDLSEVIQAMCLLIRSFDVTSDSTAGIERKLLGAVGMNGDDSAPSEDAAMVNGDNETDSQLESESKAAETELEHVERILMSGLEIRSDTLRVILERLHTFSGGDVTKAMRDMMTQKELIFLIHMLRIELADGGWTSRYVGAGSEDEKYDGSADPLLTSMVDFIPSDGEPGPSNQAIRAIGDLLNCAVDAVGTSGWLVGLSGDALGTEDLLESLRAEVSAGLEGCYEANTLGTFLEELERFTASKSKELKRRERRRDEVVDAVLPMGGKAEPTALKDRSGEGKKSKQVIAMEKSKRVGKYSLDRIRL